VAAVAFHFNYRSPYSYLALTQLGDLALTLHPFYVIDVMKRVGNSPTTIVCKAKGEQPRYFQNKRADRG
jgi:2-hydroxychromene-2-carboxylate isomerase